MPNSINNLSQLIGAEKVSTELIDRLALARDASLYRLVPKAVVRPTNDKDISAILRWSISSDEHVTFRAAGTSLSGQAVTNGILVDVSRGWHRVDILENGALVRAQPGVTGGRVNTLLKKHGRKIGPDPASINAAMIGGIVANNASGMCCGTQHNSYHTINSIVFTLAMGIQLDTAQQDCGDQLRESLPNVYDGLNEIKNEIRRDADLVRLIRRKYEIKNTMGYSINAFLDEECPARILGRLMVGSEGTLGFINSVTFNTIRDSPNKLTALLLFQSLADACNAVDGFKGLGAAAVELMDDASLHSFAALATTPERFRIEQKGAAALLVEYHSDTRETQDELQSRLVEHCQQLPVTQEVEWMVNELDQHLLWKLRKGLMPTIGAQRRPADTMINEDIAVPPQHLASLILDVQSAFADHGYHGAIIFGHAKDGNIHFVLNTNLASSSAIENYNHFMHRIADIVVGKYGGSLKAEHGTGRNMAPFVEMEWGAEAYAIMQRLKRLVDPNNLLNPDVLLSTNPRIHLKDIKPVPAIAPSIDACIECGFCEHVCPTRNTSTTPRQRIVLQREMSMAGNLGTTDKKKLASAYQKIASDTCAADSMCGLVCPVGIDTGEFVKSIRASSSSTFDKRVAKFLATRFFLVDGAVRVALRVANWVGPLTRKKFPVLQHVGATSFTRNVVRGSLHHDGSTSAKSATNTVDVLIYAGCPSRWFTSDGARNTEAQKLVELALRAGLNPGLIIDSSMCCGQLFDSKGLAEASNDVFNKTTHNINKLYPDQNIPIVIDTSTCAEIFTRKGQVNGRKAMSELEFLHHYILPKIPINDKVDHITFHAGCGVNKLDQRKLLSAISERCGNTFNELPQNCCGMAGDKGMFNTEVLEGALQNFENETQDVGYFVTCNSACSVGFRYTLRTEIHSPADLLFDLTTP